MSLYQTIGEIGPRYISRAKLFKFGFNFSPMYRKSTAKLTYVSEDLLTVRIKLPISYKNKNYVGSIFGGSMFSSVDPIPMVQLINILEDEYIVWDKSAEIFFKAPAREDLYAEFTYTVEEVEEIKRKIAEKREIVIVKTTRLTSQDGSRVFCEVRKSIYIASKSHYREKKKL